MVKRIFNKRASRGMAVLMAAAMVGTMSPVSLPTQPTWMVQAATTTPTVATTEANVKVSVKYASETLSLTELASGVDTVYYAITTVTDFAEDNVKKYPKASAYEAVAATDASDIDLSWANLTKDNTYLFVTTDPDVTKVKPKYEKLAKQNTKLKVAYAPKKEENQTAIGDADNGYLVLDNQNNKTNPDGIAFSDLEYKTENTAWKDCPAADASFSLKRFVAKGATLQIRVKASDDSGKARPAGKIFKVKVAAKAKAPKLTVDYLKHTIKFPKNTEYKKGSETGWTPMDDTNAISIYNEKIGYDGTADVTLTVRTKADKKAPSRETKVVLPKYKPAPSATVADKTKTAPDKTVGKVSIDYVVPYEVKKGIQFTNCCEEPMQFAIVKRPDTISSLNAATPLDAAKVTALDITDKDKVKWTNVAAAKLKTDDTLDKEGVGKITKIDNAAITDTTEFDKYMVIYRTADKKATVISTIMAAPLPAKLEQTITVGGKKESEIQLQEVKADANTELEISIDRTVSDDSKYTVTAFKAKQDSSKYVADGSKVSDIKGTVESGKLKIKATAKAQGNYILNVKREGAEFNVPVHVFKSTTATITADNTVSAVSVADAGKEQVTAVIGKDKKSVVVTSKNKTTSAILVTLTVADSSTEAGTKAVKKYVTIDADGKITVSDSQ